MIRGIRIENGMTLFWGSIFSNFHSCKFTSNGTTFNCSEQYFMLKKALHFRDERIARLILQETDPKEHKKLGQKVKLFSESEWTNVSVNYMTEACTLKFEQNPDLMEQLLSTYPTILVEASPFDDIWGIKLGKDDPLAWNKSTWRGKNLLGQVLMAVREEHLNVGNITTQ